MNRWQIPLQVDVALHPDELREVVQGAEFQEKMEQREYQTHWHEGRGELQVRGRDELGSTRPLYRAHIVSGKAGALLDGAVAPSKSNKVDITFSILAGITLVAALSFWGAEGEAERGVWAFGMVAVLFAGVPLFNRLMASVSQDDVMFQIEVEPMAAALREILAPRTDAELEAEIGRDEKWYPKVQRPSTEELREVLIDAKNGAEHTWTDDVGREWVAYPEGRTVRLALAGGREYPLRTYDFTEIEQLEKPQEAEKAQEEEAGAERP